MKAPPAFQFYPGDWLSSSDVQSMSLAAQGAYIRLLCYQWKDGSIPNDVQKLNALMSVKVPRFDILWEQIKQCFDLEIETGRIANRRLEAVRSQQLAYRNKQAEFGKHGAEKRKVASGYPDKTLEGKASTSSSTSPSSPSSGENTEEREGDPSPEKRRGRPDPAADLFAVEYLKQIGNPYGWHPGDFPQLAKLRKRLKIGTTETPADWEPALLNYFASPFAKRSLQHFATDFDTFKNSRLDRYKTPVDHVNGGNGNGSRTDFNLEEARRLRARLDSQDRSSGQRETAGGQPVGLPGAAAKTHT